MYHYTLIFLIVVYFVAHSWIDTGMCECVYQNLLFIHTISLLTTIQIVFRFFPITNNAAVCMFILMVTRVLSDVPKSEIVDKRAYMP